MTSRAQGALLACLLVGCGGGAGARGRAADAAPGSAGPAVAALTPAQIAARAMPSIVLIRTPEGLGTGFVVSQDGRIATNLHVIEDASEAVVVLSDGSELDDVEVVDVDAGHDLAVLRVRAANLHALPLGDLGAVHAGDRVVAIGHPLGLGNTVSDGLVSAVRVVDDSLTLLQISAPIAPGSSGGPLFNERGEVIGVATLFSSEGQNLNFGVPVSYLAPMLRAVEGTPIGEFGRAAAAHRPHAPPRSVPQHDLKVLASCSQHDLELTMATLEGAIEIGAPLYNDGNPDACFRIYEGAALELEKALRGCSGVKKALAAGVTRASALASPVDKAWAMRDAFDGVVDVVMRKIAPGHPKL